MNPILIGYFPKRTLKRPDWLHASEVEEVCSVSTCISKGPEGWIDHWRHNEMWVYDTPELALSVIPESARSEFEIHAYRMFPVAFDDGIENSFEFPLLNIQPMPTSFERLGLDVVSRSCGHVFECSPLSCNRMAEGTTVNRHCLIEHVDAALLFATNCEEEGCEPGPYHIVEVWRERKSPHS